MDKSQPVVGRKRSRRRALLLGRVSAGSTTPPTGETVGTSAGLSAALATSSILANSIGIASGAALVVGKSFIEQPPHNFPLAPDSFYAIEGLTGEALIGELTADTGTATGGTLVSQEDPYGNSLAPITFFEVNGLSLKMAPGETLDYEATENATTQNGKRGTTWYRVVVDLDLAGGGVERKTFLVRGKMRDTRDVVTGDPTNNIDPVTTLSVDDPTGFRNRITAPANNRTIVIDPDLHGVHQKFAHHTGMPMQAENLTVIGHEKAIVGKGVPIQTTTTSRNYIFRNLAHAPGIDDPGADMGDRDGIQLWNGFDMIVDRNTVVWTIDEAIQIGRVNRPAVPRVRHILIYRSLIAEPSWAALRPDESERARHPFGPLIGDFGSYIWFVESAILGFTQRSPLFGQCFMCGAQNCVIAYGGSAGMGFVGDLSTPPTSVIARNNLFRPGYEFSERTRALTIYSSHGPNTEVHLHGNHFIGDHTGFNFADDPVLVPDHVQQKGSAGPEIFVPYYPFMPSDQLNAELQPTDTPTQREALFFNIMGDVGNNSVISQRIIDNFVNGVDFTGSGALPASGGLSRPEHPDDVGGYVF